MKGKGKEKGKISNSAVARNTHEFARISLNYLSKKNYKHLKHFFFFFLSARNEDQSLFHMRLFGQAFVKICNAFPIKNKPTSNQYDLPIQSLGTEPHLIFVTTTFQNFPVSNIQRDRAPL